MAAAMGVLHGVPVEFESVKNVPSGGVLLALPALLQNGLLVHSRQPFSMPEGYYPLESIFLLLAIPGSRGMGQAHGAGPHPRGAHPAGQTERVVLAQW
jgi:hypothetical protein